MKGGVRDLMTKIAKYRPRIVCFLAKSVWEVFIKQVYHMSRPPVTQAQSAPRKSPSSSKTPRTLRSSRFFSGMEDTAVDTSHSKGRKESTAESSHVDTPKARVQVPKYHFEWGLQPFKTTHRQMCTQPHSLAGIDILHTLHASR